MLDSSGMVWDRFEPNRLNSFLPFEKIARFRNHFTSLKASIEIAKRVPKFQAAKLPVELRDSYLAFNEMYARTSSNLDQNVRYKRMREMCTPEMFREAEARMSEDVNDSKSLAGFRVQPRLVQLRLVPVNRESSQPAYAQATISFETVWKDSTSTEETDVSNRKKKKTKRGRRKRKTSSTITTSKTETWNKRYPNPFGEAKYVNEETGQVVTGSVPYTHQDVRLNISPVEITENDQTRFAVYEIPLYGRLREWRLASL
eukprot:g2025.t1